MANLIETVAAVDGGNEWTTGIYQLEQEDLVLGGPDGIDNQQAKDLLARTNWLKQQLLLRATIAYVDAAVAALVNASPAALDTLNELAAALGNDANFATTMTNALALKAPLASPALTGNPTAPTQAPGNSSTRLATTEFVTAALGGLSGYQPLDADLTALAALASAANKLPYATGAQAWALTTLSAFGRSLIDDADAATARATLGAASPADIATAIANLVASSPAALDTLNELAAALGNDANFATTMTNALAGKQPLDADLTALAALASAADKLPYATGAQAWALTTLSAFGRSLIDDADAATARATLGIGNNGDVVAWCNFNGTGTVAIRASGNVTSITDNGTGDYTVNFTTALADANYGWSIGYEGYTSNVISSVGQRTSTPTTSAFRFVCTYYQNGVSDVAYACPVFFR